MTTKSESLTILDELRSNPSTWPQRLAYASTEEINTINDRTRCLVLLALHAQSSFVVPDLALARCCLEQETFRADITDTYRSALSLACALIARTRILANGTFFDIWVARHANYDTSKLVDVHWLYYLAGGMDAAQKYVEEVTVDHVLAGAGETRRKWWSHVLEENGNDEQAAVNAIKTEILDRINHDRKYLIDEKITAFVEGSWRTRTDRWAESLLSEGEDE